MNEIKPNIINIKFIDNITKILPYFYFIDTTDSHCVFTKYYQDDVRIGSGTNSYDVYYEYLDSNREHMICLSVSSVVDIIANKCPNYALDAVTAQAKCDVLNHKNQHKPYDEKINYIRQQLKHTEGLIDKWGKDLEKLKEYAKKNL